MQSAKPGRGSHAAARGPSAASAASASAIGSPPAVLVLSARILVRRLKRVGFYRTGEQKIVFCEIFLLLISAAVQDLASAHFWCGKKI
jgi:hypothetical protein